MIGKAKKIEKINDEYKSCFIVVMLAYS